MKANFKKITTIVLLCAIPLFASAAPTGAGFSNLNNYSTLNEISGVLKDTQIQAQIKSLLGGEDYNSFNQNFEEFGAPAVLKFGGMYYEGWKKGSHLRNTSAIVIYPDQRIYAAYFIPETNTLKYFTNDESCSDKIHPAIAVFAQQLGRNVHISYMTNNFRFPLTKSSQPSSNCRGASVDSASSTSARTMDSTTPTTADQVQLRSVAASIWGDSLANGWDMNADVGDVISTATSEILNCSVSFALVPKPAGFIPGWFYIASNAAQVTYYFSGLKASTTFKSCIPAAALNYRSSIEMASLGI
jgi:hypothetical protein